MPLPNQKQSPTAGHACTTEDGPVFPPTQTWRIVTPPPLKSILKGESVYVKEDLEHPLSSPLTIGVLGV